MDVKNKVDENVDENISKKNVQDKDDLTLSETSLDYDIGHYKGRLDELKCTKKTIKKTIIISMFAGAASFAVGHLLGQKLGNYLFNKNRN